MLKINKKRFCCILSTVFLASSLIAIPVHAIHIDDNSHSIGDDVSFEKNSHHNNSSNSGGSNKPKYKPLTPHSNGGGANIDKNDYNRPAGPTRPVEGPIQEPIVTTSTSYSHSSKEHTINYTWDTFESDARKRCLSHIMKDVINGSRGKHYSYTIGDEGYYITKCDELIEKINYETKTTTTTSSFSLANMKGERRYYNDSSTSSRTYETGRSRRHSYDSWWYYAKDGDVIEFPLVKTQKLDIEVPHFLVK